MSPLSSVMFVVLAIWVGLFLYLWRLDARIRELCGHSPEAAGAAGHDAPEATIEPQGKRPER